MTDVNAIRSNNLLLVNWLNGNDTTPIEQQTSSSSNILPEIGMGVAFGLPLVAGQEYIKAPKPASVFMHKLNNFGKLSWTDAWHEIGLERNLEKQYLKKLDTGWFNYIKNRQRLSEVKNLEKELPKPGSV